MLLTQSVSIAAALRAHYAGGGGPDPKAPPRPWRQRATVAAGMAALSALVTLAAAAQPAVPSHPCAAVAGGTDRLACYDAAFPPSPVERAARLEQTKSEFGLRETQPQQQAAKVAADVERIEATVASVERSPRGERIFTLDNGQRWQETNATSRGHVNEGDVVVVEKASFGTYLLVTPARAGLRVRRIK